MTVQEKLGWIDTYADYLYWRFGDPDGAGSTQAIVRIREFIEECQGHGIPMSIVLFPHVDADLSAGRYRFNYLHDRVLDACRREVATCVDLGRPSPPTPPTGHCGRAAWTPTPARSPTGWPPTGSWKCGEGSGPGTTAERVSRGDRLRS